MIDDDDGATPLINLVLVDDHPLALEGMHALLAHNPDMYVIGTARSGREALQVVAQCPPDVLVLDVRLPDMSGLEVARVVGTSFPTVNILALSGYDDTATMRMLMQMGIRGCLRKTVTGKQLADAVRKVAVGGTAIETQLLQTCLRNNALALTDRELEVLRLVVAGLRNSEIARHLAVSVKAIEYHVRSLLEKLGVRSRAAAIRMAIQQGIISLDHHDVPEINEQSV